MNREAEFLSIVEDLSLLLESGEDLPPFCYRGELSPLDAEFLYEPPQNSTFAKTEEDQREQTLQEESPAKVGSDASFSTLPANVRCTLCSDRLFPFKRFLIQGSTSILVLHFSGSIKGDRPGRDLTGKQIFSTPEEDDLFARMVRAAGWQPEDLHFQQYPACLFDPSRSFPEDWNRRCESCLIHIEETVRRESIRLILLTGPSAIFLVGEDMAKKYSVSGELLPLTIGGREVPAIVLRSPAALLAYEKKREKIKLTDPEGKSPEYRKLLDEEKQVKRSVLQSLQNAKNRMI